VRRNPSGLLCKFSRSGATQIRQPDAARPQANIT
jgi:hypothetical protein